MTPYNRETCHMSHFVPSSIMSAEEVAVWSAASLARRWARTWEEYLMCLESNLVHELGRGV